MDQDSILRNLSGEQKIEQAFLLSEFVRDLAKQNIKKQLGKKATNKKIINELQKRLKY